MKESLNGLPQIDAQFEHKPDPEYAASLLDELLRFYTLNQISLHAGVCRRSLSYMRHKGMSFPVQLSLEILSGIRKLVDHNGKG